MNNTVKEILADSARQTKYKLDRRKRELQNAREALAHAEKAYSLTLVKWIDLQEYYVEDENEKG